MEVILMKICATFFWIILISVSAFLILINAKCWNGSDKKMKRFIVWSDALLIFAIIDSILTVIGYYI